MSPLIREYSPWICSYSTPHVSFHSRTYRNDFALSYQRTKCRKSFDELSWPQPKVEYLKFQAKYIRHYTSYSPFRSHSWHQCSNKSVNKIHQALFYFLHNRLMYVKLLMLRMLKEEYVQWAGILPFQHSLFCRTCQISMTSLMWRFWQISVCSV